MARSRLRENEPILIEVDLSQVLTACFEIGYPIGFYKMKHCMIPFLEKNQTQTTLVEVVEQIASEDVKMDHMQSVIGDEAPTEAAYNEAKAKIDWIRGLYLGILNEHSLDAMIWPTVPLESQSIEGTMEHVVLNSAVVPTTPTFIRNQVFASIVGAPALSLPMGVTQEGLPVGLELDGRPDYDNAIISIGLGIEAILTK